MMHARTFTTKRGRAVSLAAVRAVAGAVARNAKAKQCRMEHVRRYLAESFAGYLA